MAGVACRIKPLPVMAVAAMLLGLAIPQMAQASTATVNVPATSGPADRAGSTGFVDSGFNLNGSDSITVSATGHACSNANQCNGPAGFPGSTSCFNSVTPCPDPGDPEYSLIAKVGDGPWQEVGAGPTTLTGTGEVLFGYNDGQYDDNTGAFIASVDFTPSYAVCPLYDQTKAVHQGATIPIKLYLCDANGNDVSSSSIAVTATGLTQVSTSASGALEDSGDANPSNGFRFDSTLGPSGGYIYNLSTKPLSSGTWSLTFTAPAGAIYSGDGTYSVSFEVN